MKLFHGLKKKGCRYGTGYELATLGTSALLPKEADSTVGELIEADHFLEKQKGYGVFGLGRKQRLMHAGMLLTSDYLGTDSSPVMNFRRSQRCGFLSGSTADCGLCSGRCCRHRCRGVVLEWGLYAEFNFQPERYDPGVFRHGGRLSFAPDRDIKRRFCGDVGQIQFPGDSSDSADYRSGQSGFLSSLGYPFCPVLFFRHTGQYCGRGSSVASGAEEPVGTGESPYRLSFRGSAAVLGIAFIQNIYGNAGMAIAADDALGAVPLYNVMTVVILSFTAPGSGGFDRQSIKINQARCTH